MRNVKKLIKKYYDNNYNHNIDLEDLKDKANIKTKNKGGLILFMKTKKLAIVSTALFFVVITAIVIGCSLNNTPSNEPTVKDTVITLDLNPSIQLTVDENGKVSSVYGNNDEGKMIIIDITNELVGKDYDVAIDKIIEVETECGFFVKSTSNEDYNNLTITIDTVALQNEIDAMEAQIKKHVEEKLTELDVEIKDKITTVKNNTKEALVNKLLTLDQNLNKEELEAKTHDELLKLITAYQIERINFPTEAIEEMYNNFKEYEINIAETRIFKSIVTSSSLVNDAIINNYNSLYESANLAIANLEATYQELFINEDSTYVKALAELKNVKQEVLTLRSEVEALPEGIEKTLKLTELRTKELALHAAENALSLAQQTAYSTLNFVTSTIKQSLASLKDYIKSTEELQTLMTQNADELSAKLNQEKTEFTTNFETKYKDQITSQYNKLVEQKANLVNALKNQDK